MFVAKWGVFNIRFLCLSLETKRFVCQYDSNYRLFKNYFGLHQYKAKDYIAQNKLNKIPPETVMKVVVYCEERGFSKEDILQNPSILRTHPDTVDQHYSVMTEAGFKNITVKALSKFRTLLRRTINTLKEFEFLDFDTDVAENFIKHLHPRPDCLNVKTTSDYDILVDVHQRVLIDYLKWRLKVPEVAIAKLIKVHPTVQRKSFRYLCENIFLAEELGFTHEKILKYGYILHAHPKHVKELLEKFPEIAGVSMKRAMRMYPKLITAVPENVQKVYDMLKAHNIPEEAMAKRLNVFYLSPETVSFRLAELNRIHDFKVLLHNPNILKLLVHHNRAKSRLSFLKELQLKCATVTVLGTDDVKFENHIKEGRDVNSPTEMYAFVRGVFKKESHDFESVLKQHPYFLQVPFTAMEDTYNYLISEKFHNSSIFKVLYILLYPKEKIKKSFQQVKQYEEQTNQALTQMNRLNLALYFIEKEHHFSGDGIWIKTEAPDESIHSS